MRQALGSPERSDDDSGVVGFLDIEEEGELCIIDGMGDWVVGVGEDFAGADGAEFLEGVWFLGLIHL